jgi:DNA (cytosine-5)-methyltransferase 1
MRKLTHGSLFSGIGGFDLAAEWMGWDNKFHCEWNEFGQKVLHHYWPEAESFTDITKTDFTKYYGKIDILTGGFPCQPYSSAGKRKGKEDERHLWPEMLRTIREVSPRFVVGENVRGLTNWNGGMVFEEVCAELESYGYQVAPVIIPACAVNAPHRRERIWFIAYAESVRRDGRGGRRGQDLKENETGICEYRSERSEMGAKSERHSQEQNATDTSSVRFREYSTNQQLQSEAYRTPNGMDEEITTDAERVRLEYSTTPGQVSGKEKNANGERNKSTLFIETDDNGYKPSWDNFPTQSPICSGDDGLSGELDGITFSKWRNESIKAYGNAIVPQVAFQIFKAIEKTLYL